MAFFLRSLGLFWILHLWKSNLFVQCYGCKLNQRYWPYSCWVYNCEYTSTSSLHVSFRWFYCSVQQCDSCYSRNASYTTWSKRSEFFLYDVSLATRDFCSQLRLVQTMCQWIHWTVHLKFRPNNLHYLSSTYRHLAGWLQHVAHVWLLCCNMLGVVGFSLKLVKFEPTTPNILQHVLTGQANKHRMFLNNFVMFCIDMFQSFGWGFRILKTKRHL